MRTPLLTLTILMAFTQSAFMCAPAIDEPVKACSPGEAPATPIVEIGRVDMAGVFEELTAEQVYVREFGSQGGQHIYLSLRFYAPEGESDWAHTFRITDGQGMEFGSRSTQHETCAPGWTVLENIRVFVDGTGTSTGNVEVESGPIDDYGDHTRVIKASGTIQIQWP